MKILYFVIIISVSSLNASFDIAQLAAATFSARHKALVQEAEKGDLRALKELMELAKQEQDYAEYIKWKTRFDARCYQDAYCTKNPLKYLPFDEPTAENTRTRKQIDAHLPLDQQIAIMHDQIGAVAAITDLPNPLDILFIDNKYRPALSEEQKRITLKEKMVTPAIWQERRTRALEVFQRKLPKKPEPPAAQQQAPDWYQYAGIPSKTKAALKAKKSKKS